MKVWGFVVAALIGGAAAVAACGGGAGIGTGFSPADSGPDARQFDAGLLSAGDGGAPGACNPLTCALLGYTCGKTGDGCGGMLDCGSCTGPATCGGGGVFSVCGGGGPCVPTTCAKLGATCGPEGDGCGGLLQCGSCTAPDVCGGGGQPSVCGTNGPPNPDGGLDGGPCVPKTCASQNLTCGPGGDGCGNVLACGTCATPGDSCGGGGTNGVCGHPGGTCVPTTCAKLGFNCGPAADGCGGLLQCGSSCPPPSICGGGGQPGVCGSSVPCTNLCPLQTTCAGGGTTTLSGTVVAGTLPTYIPAGDSPDPVPNVLVYVPNSTPASFTKGVQCNACGGDVSGSPLIGTTTDAAGHFTLTNVPVMPAGQLLPLVIQLGRWRRIFGLGNALNPGFSISGCATNNIGQVRMPRNQSEGDIPLTAISTGQIDPMECVLLKMGVDQAEFRDPGAGGRIEIYQGNGARVDTSTPPETTLVPDVAGATTVLGQYDQVLFPCWGKDPIASVQAGSTVNVKTANQQQNIVSYTTAGGRMFGTHLSYSWLYFASDAPFNTTATWVGEPVAGGTPDLEYNTGTAQINPAGGADVATFYTWMDGLAWSGATNGSFSIVQERNNFSAVGAGSSLWVSVSNAAPAISGQPTAFPVVYTFNTPYSTATPPPAQCGKVVYSDFHVSNIQGGGSNDSADFFPAQCTPTPMSAQEKALEYLIWDLASCLPAPAMPTCVAKTCADLGATCGPAGDGCGGTLQCGSCGGCETCGGGGTPSVCGGACCVPLTCTSLNLSCGPAGDGCGNQIQCGNCPPGLTCGGGGINGVCGALDAGPTCQPRNCLQQNTQCGPAGDGCGGLLQCGSCPTGQSCGGGGTNGVCGPVCAPKTCAELGFNCGPTGDGCGSELQCGTCTPPQTCGGGGKSSVCGGSGAK